MFLTHRKLETSFYTCAAGLQWPANPLRVIWIGTEGSSSWTIIRQSISSEVQPDESQGHTSIKQEPTNLLKVDGWISLTLTDSAGMIWTRLKPQQIQFLGTFLGLKRRNSTAKTQTNFMALTSIKEVLQRAIPFEYSRLQTTISKPVEGPTMMSQDKSAPSESSAPMLFKMVWNDFTLLQERQRFIMPVNKTNSFGPQVKSLACLPVTFPRQRNGFSPNGKSNVKPLNNWKQRSFVFGPPAAEVIQPRLMACESSLWKWMEI